MNINCPVSVNLGSFPHLTSTDKFENCEMKSASNGQVRTKREIKFPAKISWFTVI